MDLLSNDDAIDLAEFEKHHQDLRYFYDLREYRSKGAEVRYQDQLEDVLKRVYAVGTYGWFIFDLRKNKIIRVGGSYEKLTGYTEHELVNSNWAFSLKIVSMKEVIFLVSSVNKFWKYFYSQPVENRPFIKASYTYHFIRKDGSMFDALQQGSTLLFDQEGNAILQFELITDISQLKSGNIPHYYIVDSTDESHVKQIPVKGLFSSKAPKQAVSGAQLRVIRLLARGMSSRQIAAELSLSEHTVNTHRRNILQNTGCSNTAELIRYAVVNGLL